MVSVALSRATAFGFSLPQSYRGEGRFDWVGGSEMLPVLGWEVVECQEYVTIFLEALAGSVVLRAVLFQEVVEGLVGILARFRHPDFVDVGFRLWLNTLGHLVEDIAGLVEPTTLLGGFSEDLANRCPETESSIANCQLRSLLETSFLKIHEQFMPTLFAFAIAIGNETC